jgi:hypothetical protein
MSARPGKSRWHRVTSSVTNAPRTVPETAASPMRYGSTCQSTPRDGATKSRERLHLTRGRSKAELHSRNRLPPGQPARAVPRSPATPAAGYARCRARCRTTRANQSRVAAASTAHFQVRRSQARVAGLTGAQMPARRPREWDIAAGLKARHGRRCYAEVNLRRVRDGRSGGRRHLRRDAPQRRHAGGDREREFRSGHRRRALCVSCLAGLRQAEMAVLRVGHGNDDRPDLPLHCSAVLQGP